MGWAEECDEDVADELRLGAEVDAELRLELPHHAAGRYSGAAAAGGLADKELHDGCSWVRWNREPTRTQLNCVFPTAMATAMPPRRRGVARGIEAEIAVAAEAMRNLREAAVSLAGAGRSEKDDDEYLRQHQAAALDFDVRRQFLPTTDLSVQTLFLCSIRAYGRVTAGRISFDCSRIQ
ncbi:hypothetical protein EJB05_02253, partial [Eragrostis curvula]